ncbi:MAG: ribbon-helix-helix domain-containing protein [Gemmataceae bacterium]
MQEHLPPELKDMVKELLDSGTYHSFEEIVHDALWLARNHFLLYKVKREELLALLEVGIQQADRGEVVEGELVFAKLQERIKQRSSQSP